MKMEITIVGPGLYRSETIEAWSPFESAAVVGREVSEKLLDNSPRVNEQQCVDERPEP